MPTYNLTLRTLQATTLAFAVWDIRNTITVQQITQTAYDAFVKQNTPLAKPDPDAVWVMGWGGVPALNTADGTAAPGDCWQAGNNLFVKVASGHDFAYSTLDYSGNGFKFEAHSHLLRIPGITFATHLDVDPALLPPDVTISNGRITIPILFQAEAVKEVIVPPIGGAPQHQSIGFDVATSATGEASGTTLAWSHTCTGSDLALVGGIRWDTSSVTATGTYNTVTMDSAPGTQFVNNTGDQYGALFALLDPASGAHSLSLTCGVGYGAPNGIGVSLTGVDSVRSGGPWVADNAYPNADTPTIAVTTVADDWVVDLCYYSADGTVAAGANQDERKRIIADAANHYWLSSTEVATTTTTTMTWTATDTAYDYGILAIAFIPVAGVSDLSASTEDTITISDNPSLTRVGVVGSPWNQYAQQQ